MKRESKKRRGRKSPMLVILAVSTVPLAARAQVDRYYVGGNNTDWNNPANWSATSGGPGGASVPVAGDNAYVNGPNGNVVLFDGNYAGALGDLNIDQTFTHSINFLRGSYFTVGANSAGTY